MRRRRHLYALLAVSALLGALTAGCGGSSGSASSSSGSGGSADGGPATTAKYPCKAVPGGDGAAGGSSGTTFPVTSTCEALVPVLEFTDSNQPPAYFRSFAQTAQNPPAKVTDTKGLAGSPVSGGASPTPGGLAALTSTLGTDDVLVVDLRAESHGLINGDVVGWFGAQAGLGPNAGNDGRSDSEAAANEAAILATTAQQTGLALNGDMPPYTTTSVLVQQVQSEQTATQAAGLQYQRIYVDDSTHLKDDEVEKIIAAYRGLQPGQQLYVHCNNGWDRTTQALAVIDILENADQVSLQDIGNRQMALSQVFDKLLEGQRLALMQRVYDWAQQSPGGDSSSWAAYAKANPQPANTGTTGTTS